MLDSVTVSRLQEWFCWASITMSLIHGKTMASISIGREQMSIILAQAMACKRKLAGVWV